MYIFCRAGYSLIDWVADGSITQDPDSESLMVINVLTGMGILTDDDSLIDAALSELISLPLDLHHRRYFRAAIGLGKRPI